MKKIPLLLFLTLLVMAPWQVRAMIRGEEKNVEEESIQEETVKEYTEETEEKAVIEENRSRGNSDASPSGKCLRSSGSNEGEERKIAPALSSTEKLKDMIPTDQNIISSPTINNRNDANANVRPSEANLNTEGKPQNNFNDHELTTTTTDSLTKNKFHEAQEKINSSLNANDPDPDPESLNPVFVAQLSDEEGGDYLKKEYNRLVVAIKGLSELKNEGAIGINQEEVLEKLLQQEQKLRKKINDKVEKAGIAATWKDAGSRIVDVLESESNLGLVAQTIANNVLPSLETEKTKAAKNYLRCKEAVSTIDAPLAELLSSISLQEAQEAIDHHIKEANYDNLIMLKMFNEKPELLNSISKESKALVEEQRKVFGEKFKEELRLLCYETLGRRTLSAAWSDFDAYRNAYLTTSGRFKPRNGLYPHETRSFAKVLQEVDSPQFEAVNNMLENAKAHFSLLEGLVDHLSLLPETERPHFLKVLEVNNRYAQAVHERNMLLARGTDPQLLSESRTLLQWQLQKKGESILNPEEKEEVNKIANGLNDCFGIYVGDTDVHSLIKNGLLEKKHKVKIENQRRMFELLAAQELLNERRTFLENKKYYYLRKFQEGQRVYSYLAKHEHPWELVHEGFSVDGVSYPSLSWSNKELYQLAVLHYKKAEEALKASAPEEQRYLLHNAADLEDNDPGKPSYPEKAYLNRRAAEVFLLTWQNGFEVNPFSHKIHPFRYYSYVGACYFQKASDLVDKIEVLKKAENHELAKCYETICPSFFKQGEFYSNDAKRYSWQEQKSTDLEHNIRTSLQEADAEAIRQGVEPFVPEGTPDTLFNVISY